MIVTIDLPSAPHKMKKTENKGNEPLLVVDDDEYSRLYCERIIKKLGHKVESVALGYDALDKVKAKKNSAPLF